MQQQIITTLTIDDIKAIIKESVQELITQLLPKQEEMKNEEPLMTTAEVCEYLKVSTVTIWHWKRRGMIPFHRIGRKIYFRQNEVDEAMATRQLLKRR